MEIFMRKISDTQLIRQLVEQHHISDCFSAPDLNFQLYQFEKREQITSPDRKLDEILFVVNGTVRIYGIRDNGSISPVNQQKAPVIIGDMEFAEGGNPPFFTEAVTDVTCIALTVKEYEAQLHQDIRFLHMLLQSYSQKLKIFAFVDVPAETIEERVLLYLENICPSHELKGIEAAVLQLRCSRRQLQRVLKKLCDERKVIKTARGRYRLADCPSYNQKE